MFNGFRQQNNHLSHRAKQPLSHKEFWRQSSCDRRIMNKGWNSTWSGTAEKDPWHVLEWCAIPVSKGSLPPPLQERAVAQQVTCSYGSASTVTIAISGYSWAIGPHTVPVGATDIRRFPDRKRTDSGPSDHMILPACEVSTTVSWVMISTAPLPNSLEILEPMISWTCHIHFGDFRSDWQNHCSSRHGELPGKTQTPHVTLA